MTITSAPPGGAPAPPAEQARHRNTGAVVSAFFTLYLVPLAGTAVADNPHGLPTWLIIAAYIAFAPLFVAVPVLARTGSPARNAVALVLIFGFATGLFAAGGDGTLFIFIFPLNTVAFAVPMRTAIAVDAVVVAALTAYTAARIGAGDAVGLLQLLGSMAVITLLLSRLIGANHELRRAHERIAALAAREERARIARDLHDVLGHTLTTVAVKAALARRVLESTGGDERAVAEVTDVEELTRRTLGEVRATVSGYRTPSLAAELASARAALTAADIAADLPTAVDEVAEPQLTAFAYALREGVTNVVRHSGARRCTVRIGAGELVVADDGRGCAGAPFGNGLDGLRERLAAIGATLHTATGPAGGCVLTVKARP